MSGALANAAGIVLGGMFAFAMRRPLSGRFQTLAKIVLGVFMVYLGLQLTWKSLNGSFGQILKELGIVLLAMILGRMPGRLLRLQQASNAIGQYATRLMADADKKKSFNDGFLIAAGLFCAAPLAFLAPLDEGLNGFSKLFLIKAGTDALAVIAFRPMFGWSPMLAAIPVLALEGILTQLAQLLGPWLARQPGPLVDSINATNGLLVFCVAAIILEIKKVRVAEYLPSLVLAPLLTRWMW